jgi:predicted enzyme related to lactoylglutathione lyase
MGPMGVYQLFARGAEPIGGMMTKQDAVPHPFWLFYFNVEGTTEAAGRVEAAGGRVLNGPMEVPGGMWILHCIDPQGAMFALVAARR